MLIALAAIGSTICQKEEEILASGPRRKRVLQQRAVSYQAYWIGVMHSHHRRERSCSWTRFEVGVGSRVGAPLAQNSLSYIPASWFTTKRASVTEANRRRVASWWLTVMLFQPVGL